MAHGNGPQFTPLLPPGFIAEPRVHLGQSYEIDVSTYEDYTETGTYSTGSLDSTNGGTATLSPPRPLLTLETEFSEEYSYEVLVLDLNRDC